MRILVAMSGGVDSSTVAGLLHEAGHEVIGVTLQLYDHGAATGRKGACCAGQDIHDARRVADHLGIPHYVIDAEKRFADAVIGDFADSYAAGETPVPCVRCNQTVKFTDLTGAGPRVSAPSGWRPGIMCGGSTARTARNCIAPSTWRATRAGSCSPPRASSLRFALFPLGEMADKRAVRARGRAARPAGGGEAGQPGHLLRRHRATMPIRWCGCARMPASRATSSSRDGRVLGRHDGIARYTVGQGKRLGAAAVDRGERQVVVALDPGAAARGRGPARCRHARRFACAR